VSLCQSGVWKQVSWIVFFLAVPVSHWIPHIYTSPAMLPAHTRADGCVWLKGEVGWDMAVQFFVNLAAMFYV
jgi:hypothetical protein